MSHTDVEAALRLRERLGFRGEGERGMYLCHTFCELGFTPLGEMLGELRDFLVAHPSEVVVVINQDAVTPADFVGAVDAAGLSPLMATPPPPGAPWPTLGEMVAAGRRLVILAEDEAGAAPWYQLVYARLVQETPFTFASTAALTDPARLPASCRENRGEPSARLFLLNHWVNTDPRPLPRNAAIVNAYEPLLRAGTHVRADPRPAAEPDRGRLLPPRRRVPGRRHAQRAVSRAPSREWRRDVSGVAAARATTGSWPTTSVAVRARVIAV